MTMAKPKTRKTISVPGPLYWAFDAYCTDTGEAKAAIVTDLLRALLKDGGYPTEAERPADKPLKKRDGYKGAHWTF